MLEQCGKEGPPLGGGPSNIYRKVIGGLILSYRRIYFLELFLSAYSISWAGVYDCFGGFETKSPKNPKLVVRMVFNGISIFFPSFVQELVILVYQLFLQVYCFYVDCFCFFFEIYNQIKYAILVSPYNF